MEVELAHQQIVVDVPQKHQNKDRPNGLVIGSLANDSFYEANSAFQ